MDAKTVASNAGRALALHRTGQLQSALTPNVVTDSSGAPVGQPVDFSQSIGSSFSPSPMGPIPMLNPPPPGAMVPPGPDYTSQINSIYQPVIDTMSQPQKPPGYMDSVAQAIANNPLTPSFGYRPRGVDAFFQNLIAGTANSWANQHLAGIQRPAQQQQAALDLANTRAAALKAAIEGQLTQSTIAKNQADATKALTPGASKYATPAQLASLHMPMSMQAIPISQWTPEDQAKLAPATVSPYMAAGFDPKAIAARVVSGLEPPDLSGFTSRGQGGAVASEIAKLDPTFNRNTAVQDYKAVNRYWGTLNGRQQIQIRQSANTLNQMFPQIKQTAEQLYALVGPSNVSALNNLKVGAAQDWDAYGAQAQALRQRLVTLMASAQPELANVYQAGGVPSDKAIEMSKSAISADMPLNRLRTAVDTEFDNLRYRANSIGQVSAITPDNPYEPQFNTPNPNDLAKARSVVRSLGVIK